MSDFTIEVVGLSGALSRLGERAEDLRRRTQAALVIEAEEILTEAKERTPVDEGVLRSTGHVVHPSGDELGVILAFGGPAAPYAVAVHENVTAQHPVGQAKFLESAFIEARPELAERIAARLKGQG